MVGEITERDMGIFGLHRMRWGDGSRGRDSVMGRIWSRGRRINDGLGRRLDRRRLLDQVRGSLGRVQGRKGGRSRKKMDKGRVLVGGSRSERSIVTCRRRRRSEREDLLVENDVTGNNNIIGGEVQASISAMRGGIA